MTDLPAGGKGWPQTQKVPRGATTGRHAHSAHLSMLILSPLVLLLLLWLWLFYAEGAFRGGPNGRSFGADFGMYYSAAQVLQHAGNPYDVATLYRAESSLMERDHLRIVELKTSVRVGSPPLLIWATQPLTRLPYQTAAWLWCIALYLLSIVGLLGTLSFLGWRRRMLPVFLFLMMPPVVLMAFYGNDVGLIVAAFGLALGLSRRFPLVAGLLLSVGIIKPHIALPLAVIIVCFGEPPSRSRLALGFGLGLSLMLGLTCLAVGPTSLRQWWIGLTGYSHYTNQTPAVASLTGLYVRWAPPTLTTLIKGVSLLAVIAATVSVFWRQRRTSRVKIAAMASLWFLWFLAAPYAHFYDEVLLTLPVLVLLGRDGRHITCPLPAIGLYLMFGSLLLISWTPMNVQLLSLPLCLVAAFMVWSCRTVRYVNL